MTRSFRTPQAVAAALALVGLAFVLTARAQDSGTPPAAALQPAPAPDSGYAYRRRPAPPAPVLPTAPPGARLAAGAPIPAGELEAFVDGVVREGMLQDHVPGVAVSVVQNGQVVLKKGYGFASYAPRQAVDPDKTLFRLGAISSSFTWIAVMKEVEQSRMRLDAQINIYLPEKLQVRDQGMSEPVRLRDLATHSAGFEDRALGRLFERDPTRVRPLDVFLRQERPRRVAQPGLRAEYSVYGAALAGEAVSQVTGKPYEDLIEAEILRPLGLNNTSFREPRPAVAGLPAPLPAALARSFAQGYRWTGLELQPRPFPYGGQAAPAQSASSTAGDMARYMSLLLNGGTLDGAAIYGPATVQAQRTVLMRGASGLDGWTLGLMERRLPGGFADFGLQGSTLSFNARMATVPALNLGVFAAGNSETARGLTERLPSLIVEHFYAAPKVAPPSPAADPSALRAIYAGHYLSEQRRHGGLEKFVDLLTRTAIIDVDRRGLLMVREPAGPGVWVQSGDNSFVTLGRDKASAFQVQDGRAVRWFSPAGDQSYERVGWFLQPVGLAVVGALSVIAGIATLVGLFVRDRRDFRQTSVQRRSSALQTTASILWILSILALIAWGWGSEGMADAARSYFDWPGGFILIASACALVAAGASAGQVLMLPSVWRGGRRLDSWTTGRKLSFTFTVILYALFSAMLAAWGALEPWNS